ncbi:MAG: phytase [Agriterribacter sp.]
MKSWISCLPATLVFLSSCSNSQHTTQNSVGDTTAIKPVVVTEKVLDDSDDPAIWIDTANLHNSLIIGTDKNNDNGGLYVFGLNGKINREKTALGLKRMNNADVAYGFKTGTGYTDIVAATERERNSIRIFSLPDMKPLDNGGIEVFTGEAERSPMGIALYKRASDSAVFAIVGRKSGPAEGYLFQYLLKPNGNGQVQAELVRKFGKYSGKKEIESIAVDNEAGYVYYSDEQTGIRKYYADPEKGNEELALFGQGEFKDDNEGISIYKFPNGTGYILVSDQAANRFNIYPREGSNGNPHQHTLITSIPVSTNQSDGSDVTAASLPGFKDGLFVAMSTDGTFHFYSWADIAKKAGLKSATTQK